MNFFISSFEHDFLKEPIKVINHEVRKIGKYYLLHIKLEYAISFELNNNFKIFNELLLLPRFKNKKKNQFHNLPLEVHLLEVNDLKIKDMYNLGWAVLYDNFNDAKNHSILEKKQGCFKFW